MISVNKCFIIEYIVYILIKIIINVYKCHICRKHQGMVLNGDLFQLVLGAE